MAATQEAVTQTAEWSIAAEECEVCGQWIYRATTAKNHRAIVLDAKAFSEKKVLSRFKLTQRGAVYVNAHDQQCGEPGHPKHIHRQTLARALKHYPDLEDLFDAVRNAVRGETFDEEEHAALNAAYRARCSELGVVFGKPNLGFDADRPEPSDSVWDPITGRWIQ